MGLTARPVIGALLLAAGFSRRFGSSKLEAPLSEGLSIFGKSFKNASEAFDEIIVIGREELFDSGCYDTLPDASVPTSLLLCEDAESGMGHSLACGAGQLPDHWQACFICLADMPFVQPSTLQQLRIQASPDRIIQPYWQQQRGQPVGFGKQFFAQLLECRGDKGASDLLQRHRDALHLIEVDDSGVIQDIDTPADLP